MSETVVVAAVSAAVGNSPAQLTPAGAHLPENIGTGPIDVILVELKKPAAK